MKKYPFKFLDAYGKEDTGIFFGRDEEINTLYEMVFQSSILLVYGASGTGKTSLIQCGLASKFPSHDWLALTIRRGNNINANFEKALADAGGKISTEQDNMDWLTEVMEETEVVSTPPLLTPLAQAFKAIYLNSFKPVYLIFDQFEELFILGSKEEEQQFIATVQEILQIEQPVKMIFSIREEYLGYLYDFEKAVPQLLRKKLRVEPMNLNKVLQVIEGATSYKNSIVRLKTDEAKLIAEGIFEKIKDKEKSLTIQLPYLQVFLDKLYLEITADETRQREAVFTAQALNAIGDIGDILQNFLEEQVAGISRKLSEGDSIISPATVWSILSPFATLEGTKEPIRKKGLYERLPHLKLSLIDAVVEAFINGRILRYAEDVDLYELAHDSLAQRIAEKRSDEEIALLEIKRLIKAHSSLKANARELFSEKQLNFIEPFLGKLQLTTEEMALIDESREAVASHKEKEKQQLEKEKRDLLERQQLLEKNQNSQKRFIRWITAALIIMIGIAVWAYSEKQRADNSKTVAINAEYSTKIALAKAKASEKAAVKAQDATKIALKNANNATIAAVKARNSTKIALASANKSEKKALTQREKADQAEKRATNEAATAKAALAKADKLINAFYFYNGKFALAQGPNERYGFIDRKGDIVISYKYEKAEQFDYRGFAKVKVKKRVGRGRGGRIVDCLIDTADNQYLVAYKLSDLNENITALDLPDQNFKTFPEEMFRYPQLQIITYNQRSIENHIKELPPEIGQLTNLTTLILQNDELEHLPAEIGKLRNLKTLDLSYNALTDLPSEMGQLTNLQNLYLHSNNLHHLPAEIGKLKSLRILLLSKAGINSGLPPEIGQLKNLQNLDLSDNLLGELPSEIWQLTNLQNLDLHHTTLKNLSAGIGKLTNLQNLNLNFGGLTYLPAEVGKLKNLQRLDLGYNNIMDLPAEIGQLKNLRELILIGNPISKSAFKKIKERLPQCKFTSSF
jgi:hypothetical protein